ncbi:hypothetical protein GC175_25920 [bacterium]|nr:hypothetical protein [bacterium]
MNHRARWSASSVGWVVLALLVCLALLLWHPRVRAADDPAVFINEIHYDNTGADTGEFVEVAGRAGTDLSGWRLIFYNGENGQSYATVNLSGTIADQQGGAGVLSFNRSGIQNGPADGVALVDVSDNVVQFLSYEGTLTAGNGPAEGMTSVDIGVSEGDSTPAGHSLQLSGAGCGYTNFAWTGPAAASPGTPNDQQTFDCSATVTPTATTTETLVATETATATATLSPTPTATSTTTSTTTASPTVTSTATDTPSPTSSSGWIINEIHADPDGSLGDANGDGTISSDDDEFVEIVNATGVLVDVGGWTLADAVQVRYTFPTGTILAPGCAVVVFGGGTPSGDFGNSLVFTTGSLGLNNGGDTVILTSGDSLMAAYTFGNEGGDNQSLVRWPDVTGGEPLVKHLSTTAGLRFSPGLRADGSPFVDCVPVTATPTATATETPSATPSATPTNSATPTQTATSTSTATASPSVTPAASVTTLPSATASPIATGTPSPTAIPVTTSTPTVTATPTETPTTTATPTSPFTPTPSTGWIINEIHADPDTNFGDANGDGTVSSDDDEFVEIVNATGALMDVGGWTLTDAVQVRFTFPAGTLLAPGCAVVIFGGGAPTGDFGNSLVFTTGSLGLNNGGDTVILKSGDFVMAAYTYSNEGNDNQSLVRVPDVTGGEPLFKHLSTAAGLRFSPGLRVDGSPFAGCVPVTATPTATATPSPSPTPTATATATQTPEATASATATDIPTATTTPIPTQTPIATEMPGSTATMTPSATATGTATAIVPETPTPTLTPTFTPMATALNRAPQAVDDEAITDEDTPIQLNLLANDTDEDGDALQLVTLGSVTLGSLRGAVDGTILYSPRTNVHGEERFRYTVRDGRGGESSAEVRVLIRPVNDAPMLAGVAAQVHSLGESVTLNLSAQDVDGDVLTFSAAGLPPGLSLDPASGEIRGFATASGQFNVTVSVSDGVETASISFTWFIDSPGGQAGTLLYLPSVARRLAQPDLVGEIRLDPNKTNFAAGEPVRILVTVRNVGAADSGPFWVDLHINPAQPPQGPPAQWNENCGRVPCFGLAWTVTGLAAGQSIDLTSDAPSTAYSIWPGSFAGGVTDLYLVVDSWGSNTGLVSESNEGNNVATVLGLVVEGEIVHAAGWELEERKNE